MSNKIFLTNVHKQNHQRKLSFFLKKVQLCTFGLNYTRNPKVMFGCWENSFYEKKKEMRKKRKMDNGAPTEFLRNQTERKAQRVREYLDRSWRQDGLLETLLALHTERRE